jgi:tetratricopeptide (TPR) repeat protein
MKTTRLALAAGLFAALVYLPALRNGFALDDSAIVERNPAAHSVGAAARAFDAPYWPPEHGAGLWRPLVILSFAADWQASGGSTTWLHATNVVLHAAVTALLVPVLAAYVGAAGAAAGAIVFAVHPVHVEAVANLVGRAELLSACWLLVAILLARLARARREVARASLALEAACLAAVLLALLSKEHAVVAVALLVLDEAALRKKDAAPLQWRLYGAILALSAAWFLVRERVEGGLGFQAVAPTFFGLGALGRVSTMLPVVFHVVRLLVWPFDLSPDYHPQVIPRLESPTWLGAAGLVLLVALVLLAARLWRSHRASAVALLCIGITWAPTSNLLFPTGIVLSERTLYLPSIGLALLAGAAFAVGAGRWSVRACVAVTALVLAPLVARSWIQIPTWRTTRDLTVSALLTHPESYKVQQAAARVFMRLDQPLNAVRSYQMADELYSRDPYLLSEYASALLSVNRVRQALALLRRSERLDSVALLTQQLLATALLRSDSAHAALGPARRAVAVGPTSAESARLLAACFVSLGRGDSARAVWPAFGARGGGRFDRWLLAATTDAALGSRDSAAAELDSAAAAVPADSLARRRFREAVLVVRGALRGPPPLAERGGQGAPTRHAPRGRD